MDRVYFGVARPHSRRFDVNVRSTHPRPPVTKRCENRGSHVSSVRQLLGRLLHRRPGWPQPEAMPSVLVELLSSASDLLSSSLAPEDAVRSFARLVVPALADWSVLTLVDEEGRPRDVESWHRDPSQRARTSRFARYRFADRVEPPTALAEIRTRQPFVVSTDAKRSRGGRCASWRLWPRLRGWNSSPLAVIPMLADDRIVGLITLARGPQRPPLSDYEIGAAVDISRRASITLTNAQSFQRERGMFECCS